MKAMKLLGDRKVGVVEAPDPQAKDDLVVIKVMASTICGTEHTYYEANDPLPLLGGTGHEAAGIVVAADKAKQVKVGDRVSIYPTVYENCHRCLPCWSGEWQRCEHPSPKRSPMGTHCQYMLVPEYVCMPIPDDMPFSTAAMIDDCLGTPYRAIKRLGVQAGQWVFITGAGPIGMSALVISNFRGARVIMADTNPYRLEQAEHFGADFVFNPAKEDVKKAVRTLTGRHGVDVSLDCSGAESAQVQCLEVLGGGGRMAFLGIRSTATTINPWKHLMSKEITVIGSWAATPQDHLDLVSMLQCGMPAQQIITHRFDLEDADEAFRTFFSGQAVKVALFPWGIE